MITLHIFFLIVGVILMIIGAFVKLEYQEHNIAFYVLMGWGTVLSVVGFLRLVVI